MSTAHTTGREHSVKIILSADPDGGSKPLATIDLGEPDHQGYFDEGDLTYTSGNLYLLTDDGATEIGSLYFWRNEDGKTTVELGHFSADRGTWCAENPLPIEPHQLTQGAQQ